ncbi:hypothetical protein FKM82_012946 [Ascaphus truei]
MQMSSVCGFIIPGHSLWETLLLSCCRFPFCCKHIKMTVCPDVFLCTFVLDFQDVFIIHRIQLFKVTFLKPLLKGMKCDIIVTSSVRIHLWEMILKKMLNPIQMRCDC